MLDFENLARYADWQYIFYSQRPTSHLYCATLQNHLATRVKHDDMFGNLTPNISVQ